MVPKAQSHIEGHNPPNNLDAVPESVRTRRMAHSNIPNDQLSIQPKYNRVLERVGLLRRICYRGEYNWTRVVVSKNGSHMYFQIVMDTAARQSNWGNLSHRALAIGGRADNAIVYSLSQ